MGGERATLIYDGECGICRRSMELVRRWDREHRIAYVAFQDPAAARFGIALPALAAAMHLVFPGPEPKVFSGADAAPEILKLLPGKRPLAAVFAVPGVRPVARRLYAWIAARRRCVVRGVPPRLG